MSKINLTSYRISYIVQQSNDSDCRRMSRRVSRARRARSARAEATAALACSAAASGASKGEQGGEARRDIRAGAKRPAGHVIMLMRLLLLLGVYYDDAA